MIKYIFNINDCDASAYRNNNDNKREGNFMEDVFN